MITVITNHVHYINEPKKIWRHEISNDTMEFPHPLDMCLAHGIKTEKKNPENICEKENENEKKKRYSGMELP